MIARREQRLAWDAADIEAGSAEILLLFDDRRLESKLPRSNRRDVSAGSGANNYDIKLFHNITGRRKRPTSTLNVRIQSCRISGHWMFGVERSALSAQKSSGIF